MRFYNRAAFSVGVRGLGAIGGLDRHPRVDLAKYLKKAGRFKRKACEGMLVVIIELCSYRKTASQRVSQGLSSQVRKFVLVPDRRSVPKARAPMYLVSGALVGFTFRI